MSNQKNHPDNVSRRHFMRQAACAALGATAMVNTLSLLRLTSAAMAQGSNQNDYKALVCIFLAGGNDSNNLIVPMGGSDLHKDYQNGRGKLALNNADLHSINVPQTTAAFGEYYGNSVFKMGVHPNAAGIANLFDDKELAFICNVGTLAFPIPSREQYLDGTIPAPRDLFSHSDQQMQWQTTVADTSISSGWGGRLAQELLDAGYNGNASKVSMSISFSGANTFQRGLSPETAAFSLSSRGAKRLVGFGYENDPYEYAYHAGGTFDNPTYQDTRLGHRLKAVESLMKLTSDNLLEETYSSRLLNSRAVFDTIDDAFNEASSQNVNFDQIFNDAKANHPLGDQLKGVAKLIAGRNKLGNDRQIFFVSVGGYDVHQDHLRSHAELMTELSTGLVAFRNVLKALNAWDNVLAYTASDFNRTFSPNSPDADSGTDHAWGGHAMAMGGPVQGGDLYGYFPSLIVGDKGNSIDAHEGHGRWIPTTSVDQYSAVLAKWFGADSNSMDAIFPNLNRFVDPASLTLGNMKFIKGG